jgi:MFS family permease
VLALGVVSLFTDIASEMVIPLLPLFVTTVLGGGAVSVGLIDGLADMAKSVLDVGAGRRVDRTGRRRPFLLFGYSLSGLVRPLMAFAAAPWQVVGVRVADRVGKGLRSSPRDSLLADQATPATRGRVYGFHRAMDHTGAVLGPLVAVGLLHWWGQDLRRIFLWAALPGALAVAVIYLFVREEPAAAKRSTGPAGAWTWLPPAELRPLLWPWAVFTLGASSDMFLLLKAAQVRSAVTTLPLLWMGLHLVKVASSLAGGPLVDRFGGRVTLSLGWLVYIAIYLAMGLASDPGQVAVLFLVYGLYHGLSEGPEKAMVARLSSAGGKGAAFGWYGLTTGVLGLLAALIFGGLWDAFGSRWAFFSGAGFAAVALALLWLQPGLAETSSLPPE